MCEPTTLILAATTLSTAVGAYGQYQQGQVSAAVARNNAIISRHQAKDAVERGRIRKAEVRRGGKQARGKARSKLAKAGVFVSGGSALEAQLDIETEAAMNEYIVGESARREAEGFERQAQGFETQGAIDIQRGTYGAAGTILGGGGTVASKWYKYKKVA